MIEYDWWMHFHEDSRPKEEGDQVAFNGINQKSQKETRYMSTFAFALCFLLSSLLHIIHVLQSPFATYPCSTSS